MSVLILKLVLTPLFIAGATLAQRRWGSAVAGLLAGLPLTSGPVSVFLAVELGRAFAVQSARGTILGTVAMSAFCVAYARGAGRFAWPPTLALAVVACVVTAGAVSQVPPDFLLSVVVSLGCLVGLVVLIGRPLAGSSARPATWWDLPARMLVATLLVVLITAEARRLGPEWSGMISSIPVYAGVLGVFSHTRVGANAAHSLLRGMSVSAFSVISFFVVVGLLLQRGDPRHLCARRVRRDGHRVRVPSARHPGEGAGRRAWGRVGGLEGADRAGQGPSGHRIGGRVSRPRIRLPRSRRSRVVELVV